MILVFVFSCLLVGCTSQTSQSDPEILEQYRQDEDQFYEDNEVIGTMKLTKSETFDYFHFEGYRYGFFDSIMVVCLFDHMAIPTILWLLSIISYFKFLC